MGNLQQIVVQITTAPITRALAQFGDSSISEDQKEIVYSELSQEEKSIWNSFIDMINAKSK